MLSERDTILPNNRYRWGACNSTGTQLWSRIYDDFDECYEDYVQEDEPMCKLEKFVVFWRGDEDDFMATALELPEGMIDTLSNQQVIQMCADVEYGTDYHNPFVGPNPASYDLIEIIGGRPTFHMK